MAKVKELRVNNIEVKYLGVILGARNVSLELHEGEIVAILGPNGAGKSTTLKAISGLLHIEDGKVTKGSISLDGEHIEHKSPEEIAALGIIQVIEGRRLFRHLTVEENLKAGGYIRSRTESNENLERVYHLFPKLKDLRNSVSGYTSGGEQQMLVIGRALMSRPKILLLDEPSLGLSPVLIHEIYNNIVRIKEEGTSIILSEQNARAALEVCEHAYVLEDGRVVLDGSAQKMKENKDIREFYLGLSDLGSKKSYREVKHYRRRKRWL